MDKNTIIQILIGLVLGGYGFIFNSILDRIKKTEERQKELDPILTEIRTSLARIETDIVWIKENKK